jgi:hypothetical protein
MMGRIRRDGIHCSPKNNLMQDSEGNEENGYPTLHPNNKKINDTRDAHKNHHNRRNPVSNH